MVVTKKFYLLHMKEEALAPSPLSTIQTALRELALDENSLKQQVSTLKQNLAPPSKGKNSTQRDLEEDRKCWWCGFFGHVSRSEIKSTCMSPLN